EGDLALHDLLEHRQRGYVGLTGGRVVSRDDIVQQLAYSVLIAASGKVLKRPDPHVARGHTGENRASKRAPVAKHLLARRNHRERSGGGDSERMHRLTNQVFP